MITSLLPVITFVFLFYIDLKAQGATISRVIFNEFTNLTNEQTLIMAYNYTYTLFSPNRPIPVMIPTTLGFDPKSPIRPYVDEENINPSLKGLNVPKVFDFHNYPTTDVLAPMYQHEMDRKQQPVQIVLGRRRDPHIVDKDNLELMLENVFTLPRHSGRNASLAESIGQYIMRKFGTIGLLTGTQVFQPSQFHDMFWEAGDAIDKGSNIIGIYPGENFYTPEDKIIVVGAHWDTTGFTDGYNDNGSGLAAMMEIARALVESGCRLQSTIIFVAFDKEEVGSQGSHEFVRGYLIPEFFKGDKWPEFQGAFILDTIMNFNVTENSQMLPSLWKDKISEATYNQVAADNFRGDYISLVSRNQPEKELAEKIEKHWNNLAMDEDFKVLATETPEKFKLRHYAVDLSATMPDIMDLTEHIHFLRSDHARFWYSNETDYQMSLQSVLFTDTGPYRGVMAQCYHRDCDSVRLEKSTKFASYEFLAMTTQTVIDTITDLAVATCSQSPRSEKIKNSRFRENEKFATDNNNEIDSASNSRSFSISALFIHFIVFNHVILFN